MLYTKPLLAVASLATSASATTFYLQNSYQGSSFFDGWNFYNGIDTNTTGNVFYESKSVATSQNLAYVNSKGNAIIKVDNQTSGVGNSTYGRSSVKILSQAKFSQGGLLLMDAVHMPFGCSVWPAYWTQGINDWPTDGEIDIMENVNVATTNKYTLHTTNGCMHPSQAASSTLETGTVVSTDCYNATNGDEGCVVQDQSTSSYGAGFAQAGGGVFATLWDDNGIKIWFFPRSSIPSDLPTNSPNPSSWTTPTAFWPTSSCNTTKFFQPQTVIFDITICGNYAGSPSVFSNGCSGTCTDLVAYPQNYNNAYFEVSYVKIFTNDSSKASSGSNSSGGGSSSSGSGSGSGSAFARYSTNVCAALLALAMIIAALA